MAVSFLFSAEKEIKFKEYGENTALPAHKKDGADKHQRRLLFKYPVCNVFLTLRFCKAVRFGRFFNCENVS